MKLNTTILNIKDIAAATLLIVFCANANAQAYKGKGDKKFQVGANFQSNATGVHVGADFGLGENISIGFTTDYLLGVQEYPYGNPVLFQVQPTQVPRFDDRFDAKARFNANLGSVIGLPETMDLYPGLNLGLKNFGTHIGFRYFFTQGFGLFAEAGVPIAKYDKSIVGPEYLNNQFVFNIGASFNF